MSNLQNLARSLIKEVEAAKVDAKAIEDTLAAFGKNVDKVGKLKPTLAGLETAYLGVIKVSDGLTVGRPSTLKEIKAATSKPTVDSVGKAKKEIERHLDEVKKSSGSDKRFAKFKTAADGLIAKLDKLVG